MRSGGLRASDADRDQVATVLNTAFAEGRITQDEHAERLDAVLKARTFDELVPITSDLAPTGPPPQVTSQTSTHALVDSRNATAEPERLVAIFGGSQRQGNYRVRRMSQAMAIFGGVDLDLQDAVFEDNRVEINGFWCFGGLNVKVPAGVQVQDHTVGIFGGSDVKNLVPADNGPVIVIKGLCLFGGVMVRGPGHSDGNRSRRRNHGCDR